MKILLIFPETPSTFWSFSNALKFVSKRSSEISLGLLTVAALLPDKWEKRLIDMNVSRLRDKHIKRADYVFITGMDIHRESFNNVVKRCNKLKVKVVAGGPMVTFSHKEFLGVDHFVLNEAEITLGEFIKDLQRGNPKKVYQSDEYPDLSSSPVPLWDILEMKKYASMNVQYSRGCPFNCEFCSISKLNGRKTRTKSVNQFLGELETLYKTKWRGGVFIVDDNFIGNKRKLKNDLLPGLIKWSKEHKYPFAFTIEASIDIADDDELMQLMVKAGVRMTFIGIETPEESSLAECSKRQNMKRDLNACVKNIQRNGLDVSGGFIVGFDNDPPGIFKRQIDFIQKSGIVTAMVGLLNAPTGTRLYKRLKSENRLLNFTSGDNTDGSINFIPKMDYKKLIKGYRTILTSIYSPKQYYERVKTFLSEYKPPLGKSPKLKFCEIEAFLKSIVKLGILGKGKKYYWKLLFLSIFKYPKKFSITVTYLIYGYHFRKVAEGI